MASKAHLFRLDPLPVYLKNRDQLIRNSVGRIDSITELERLTAEILAGAVITPVRMHWQRAIMATSRSTEGLEVKVTVPLEGYAPLLQHPPMGWIQPGPYGVLEEGSRVPGVRSPWLRLGHRFTEAASPVRVAEWARHVFDQIQHALDLQTPVIEEYNVRVPDLVKTSIAARRYELHEATTSQDLETSKSHSQLR